MLMAASADLSLKFDFHAAPDRPLGGQVSSWVPVIDSGAGLRRVSLSEIANARHSGHGAWRTHVLKSHVQGSLQLFRLLTALHIPAYAYGAG